MEKFKLKIKLTETKDLVSNWVNCAFVKSNFQLDVGSFNLHFSFNFEV